MKVVDGRTLSAEHRALLRPGEMLEVAPDEFHRLPQFYFEVESWQHAKETYLTPHFRLSELITVDCREADLLLHGFPHYVPCAVAVLARYLEDLRERVDAPICVAVNGGYRSPAHQLSGRPSPHLWGTAANIYRIVDLFEQGEFLADA
jgi:hypothetical protein